MENMSGMAARSTGFFQMPPAFSGGLQGLEHAAVNAEMMFVEEFDLEACFDEGVDDVAHRVVPTVFYSSIVGVGRGVGALRFEAQRLVAAIGVGDLQVRRPPRPRRPS